MWLFAFILIILVVFWVVRAIRDGFRQPESDPLTNRKVPIYLRWYVFILLAFVGFFGVLVTPMSLLLWPLDIVLIIIRIRLHIQRKQALGESLAKQDTLPPQKTPAVDPSAKPETTAQPLEQNDERRLTEQDILPSPRIPAVDFSPKPETTEQQTDMMEQKSDNTEHQFEQDTGRDPLFADAVDVIMETGMASVSMLQRRLKLGYYRAAHLIDQMEEEGIVGPFEGSKPRAVLVSKERWSEMKLQISQKSSLDPNLELAKTMGTAMDEVQNNPPVTRESSPSALLDFDSMDGLAFEKYCGALLSLNGYDQVQVTQGCGDQGIDILAERDGVKYAIQCKRYKGNVGNDAVQEALAGKNFYDCHVAVVLTNQHFTASAQALAKKTGVLLWGRETLLRLIMTASMQ